MPAYVPCNLHALHRCAVCHAPPKARPAPARTLGTAPLGYYHRGGPRNVAARVPGAPALNVAVTPRWGGGGAPHWRNGPVTVRRMRPVATVANAGAARKRGSYGY